MLAGYAKNLEQSYTCIKYERKLKTTNNNFNKIKNYDFIGGSYEFIVVATINYVQVKFILFYYYIIYLLYNIIK